MARKLLKLNNPEIFMINFAGRITDNNPKGHRQFAVKIPTEELAIQMKEEGWAVWYTKESEKYGPPQACITVEMRYHHEKELEYLNPKIYKVTSRKKTLLTEDLVADLERDEIIDIDLWINPSHWTVNGKSGIKAYVDTMWVTIEEDDTVLKYAHLDEVEELPFEE